jgi:hypothetical protein
LNRVIDANPNNNELTKCEFIKVKNSLAFTETNVTVIGAVDDSTVYVPPALKTQRQTDGNVYKFLATDIQVQGKDNYVSPDARSVDILGDGNTVGQSTDQIRIIGNNNIIEGGVTGVTLINTDDQTITTSDITYIDGEISESSRLVQEVTDDSNMSKLYKLTLVDTSSKQVTIQIPDPSTCTGMIFRIKLIDNTNDCIINPAGAATIDGETTLNLVNNYDSVSLQSDGDEYHII